MDDDEDNPLEVDWPELVGKRLLVGITRKDKRGNVLGQDQLHGVIEIADPARGITLELQGADAGRKYTLPPDLRAFRHARPGEYRLRSTGEVVVDPDLLATWVVVQPDA